MKRYEDAMPTLQCLLGFNAREELNCLMLSQSQQESNVVNGKGVRNKIGLHARIKYQQLHFQRSGATTQQALLYLACHHKKTTIITEV